jgi:hypothetical protein
MITTPRLRFCGTVSTRSEASAFLKSPGDGVLVERGRPRLFLLSCPCGCGEEFPINLDSRAGQAWRLYRNGRAGLSIFPSVWRTSGCKSHYVIWRNRILLFGQNEDDFDSGLQSDELAVSTDDVLRLLPATGFISFVDIAESLNAVPWDVQVLCRRLVRMKVAREGKGQQRGSFARA